MVQWGIMNGLSPADGAITFDTTPDLSWSTVNGAVRYELQLAESRAGVETAQIQSITGASYTPSSALTNGQTHYWRVRAVDGKDQKGAWSAVYSLEVEWGGISGLSPADGSSTTDTTPSLNWDAVPGAVGYEVQLAGSEAGLASASAVSVSGTSYTPTSAVSLSQTTYWRVRAKDGTGQYGSWSAAASLEVINVPTEGLLAYYPFDGNADDASGNGYHGILGGEVGHNSPSLTADRFGNQNSAYMFDSYLELIKLPHSVLDGQSEFSVSFWMKTEGSVIQRGIITGAASNYRNNELLIYIADDGEIRPHIKTNSFDGTRRINDEIWHFIVITRDNNGLTKLYVDGVLDLSDTLSAGNLDIANGGLWLGNDQDTVGGSWASSQQFLGQLDEMRIYSRVLTSGEIGLLYKE